MHGVVVLFDGGEETSDVTYKDASFLFLLKKSLFSRLRRTMHKLLTIIHPEYDPTLNTALCRIMFPTQGRCR